MSVISFAVLLALASASRPAAQEAPSPDYAFFKSRVEPIFLKKRPGHARCYVCHVVESGANAAGTAFHLEKLSPGSTFWSEEQSRRNFEVVSRLVTPGEPLSSYLLKHPLARDAGGDISHGGGRQFASQNDPRWLSGSAGEKQTVLPTSNRWPAGDWEITRCAIPGPL